MTWRDAPVYIAGRTCVIRLHICNLCEIKTTFHRNRGEFYVYSCRAQRNADCQPLFWSPMRMMDAGDENCAEPIRSRLVIDCHHLITADFVRINVDRLRRLLVLTNRNFDSPNRKSYCSMAKCECSGTRMKPCSPNKESSMFRLRRYQTKIKPAMWFHCVYARVSRFVNKIINTMFIVHAYNIHIYTLYTFSLELLL